MVQRRGLLILAVFLIVLGAAVPFVWEMRRNPAPIRLDAANETSDPLVNEMQCIDRVLRDESLKPEEVNSTLATCR